MLRPKGSCTVATTPLAVLGPAGLLKVTSKRAGLPAATSEVCGAMVAVTLATGVTMVFSVKLSGATLSPWFVVVVTLLVSVATPRATGAVKA